jgi:glycosyltransferase involved in cell wall biosynthesis
MPCRDSGGYVAASVRSALDQMSDVDELLVQDACSTDGSARILDRLAEPDTRMRVWHERDGGQSDALNRALRRARNGLVCWLNADDLLLPGALASVRAAILRHGRVPEVVVGGWRLIAGDGTVIRDCGPEPLARGPLLVRGCYVFSGAVLVRRDVFAACGGFATGLHYVMDFDLMLRLADHVTDQLVVAHPLAALRFHQDSKSGGAGRRFFMEALSVRWRGLRGPRDAAYAVAGSALHGVSVATARLRFSPGYSRLRGKAVH